MEQSVGVREGLLRFYERFSSGEAAEFAEVIARTEGVSVIGTDPVRATTIETTGSRPTSR